MLNLVKSIVLGLGLLFSVSALGSVEPFVRDAINSSAQVRVPQIGVASAVAIARANGRTYLLTNDHVCQMSRGDKSFFGFGLAPLNTHPVYIKTVKGKSVLAVVEVTTNATRNTGEMGNDVPDLCLLSTAEYISPVLMSRDELELGSPIFSVSGPQGVFPIIHDGRVGEYSNSIIATNLAISPGSSGGGVFDKDTGFLIGLVSSVLSDDQIHGSSVSYVVRGSVIDSFISRNLKRIIKRYESKKVH